MTEPAGQPAYFSILDPAGERAADSARMILETTRPFRSTADSDLIALDVGCGYGYIAVALARSCRRVMAIEPSRDLYERAREVTSGVPNVELRLMGVNDVAEQASFDLVILDNVFEHISDQPRALATIARVLKPRGLLYLLVPNKLWPIEAHYGLPFLSYLPLRWANRYLKMTGKGTDYTDASYAPTYGRLVRLLREAGFDPQFVVPRDLSLTVSQGPLHYRIGAAVLRHAPWLWRVAKGFLVIAVRRS
jgi:SAM-dependent methyltransferase